jgi:hypothetical protein
MGWIRMLHDEETHGALPDWLPSVLVFGEIPETSNYLMMPTEGSEAGKVFMFDHKSFMFLEKAPDFGSFLTWITTPSPELFEEIRRHTQYSDGETATKWLVEDYAYGT